MTAQENAPRSFYRAPSGAWLLFIIGVSLAMWIVIIEVGHAILSRIPF